ncbi:hypothetical protein CEXT_185381 [Caerostris extrusa]|uniref:Uncharacterized protein n=1 Tax=Caerostris extrusa TaxID=172846 RepID=A0AAV4NMF4_CAEEX|nr:hypothetical protein CEXT_185381 [Caerostris extrusa]
MSKLMVKERGTSIHWTLTHTDAARTDHSEPSCTKDGICRQACMSYQRIPGVILRHVLLGSGVSGESGWPEPALNIDKRCVPGSYATDAATLPATAVRTDRDLFAVDSDSKNGHDTTPCKTVGWPEFAEAATLMLLYSPPCQNSYQNTC